MIAIDKILVSDEVATEQFVCDLNHCKGGCCEDGDAGAPLDNDEVLMLQKIYNDVKPYLTADGIATIEKDGLYVYDSEFGWVTPTIRGSMCAYGFRDEAGIIKCGIEEAHRHKKTEWRKPISCHLFPIKITKSKRQHIEYVNYEPRQTLCKAACGLGKKLKVPVYVFLKEALVRKYGTEFYETLEATASHLLKNIG